MIRELIISFDYHSGKTVKKLRELEIEKKNTEDKEKLDNLKKEIEILLHKLFEQSTTYRSGGRNLQNNRHVYQTILKKTKGEERLYAMWDAIAGKHYEIAGKSIQAYVREEDE